MGTAYTDNTGLVPHPNKDMPEYLEFVYRLHKYRDWDQSLDIIDFSFCPAFWDRWKAYIVGVYGDTSNLNNTEKPHACVDVAVPMADNGIWKVGTISYEHIAASLIIHSTKNKSMIVLTPSFANDDFVILGVYSNSNYGDVNMFSQRTYCELEMTLDAHTVISPYMMKHYFEFINTGIFPSDFGERGYGIH